MLSSFKSERDRWAVRLPGSAGMYTVGCLAGILFCADTNLLAQDRTHAAESAITLRSKSRLVSIDVLVEDSRGKPVTDLEQSDFTLFDNGKQQTIRYFDKHQPPPPAADAPQSEGIQLRYSNLPDYQNPPSFNIILLDALNTSIPEQQYAQKQLVAVLQTLPPGAPIAIMSLRSELSVLQGFTSNRKLLAQTAARQTAYQSPSLVGTGEKDQQANDAENKALALAGAGAAGAGGSDSPSVSLSRERFLKQKATALEFRATWTLNAMRILATSLTKLEGRKNVFWISSAFPLALGASAPTDNSFIHDHNYAAALRTTAALLATSRIAIYPIDSQGLTVMGQAIETPGMLEIKDLLPRQTTNLLSSRETMSELADQTGGQAFYGSNDLTHALKDALLKGSSYYTLSYVPEAKDWNDQFRRIDVKLTRKKATLIFRKGYFALRKKKEETDNDAATLAEALAPAVDDPFKIGLTVAVVPPNASDKTVGFNYSIDAHNIVALGTEDSRNLRLDMVTIVWDSMSREQGRSAESLDITLHRNEYARALADGLQVPRRLLLPPGTYNVSTSIIDRTSRRLGVVRFPLVVP